MKHLPTLSVTAVCIAALVIPSPAFAGTRTAPDAAGDVVTYATPDQWPGDPDPGHTDGDITSSSLRHSARTVTATVGHAALTRGSADHFGIITIRMRTGRMQRLAEVWVDDISPGGWLRFANFKEQTVRCRGKRFSIDFTTGTVRVTVPRRCLGYPRWVRMGAWTQTQDHPGQPDQVDHDDDALTSDPNAAEDMTLGPRVYR